MKQHDFVISFIPNSPRSYRLEVVESPAGRANGMLELPFAYDDIEKILEKWKVPVDLSDTNKPDPNKNFEDWTPYDLGSAIFNALFQGEIRDCWYLSLGKIKGGLRLVLQFDARDPSLYDAMRLPWECLVEPNEARPLARKKGCSVVRMLTTKGPEQIKTLPFPDPLKIVAVVGNPDATTDIQPEDFEKELAEAQLQEADLSEAQFQGAYLFEAQLQGAVLSHTNLQDAQSLTIEQLNDACLYDTAILPLELLHRAGELEFLRDR